MINDEYVTLGSTTEALYGFGLPVMSGSAWVKYYDGTQTTADPYLLAQYGAYPNRPWSADMIGRGLCYAIVTFRHNPEVWQGFPRLRFEMGGIPLYDIRKDSTAGGSGTHRWATPSTWAQTTNPMVMIYNIMRGIALMDGSVWGGRVEVRVTATGAIVHRGSYHDVSVGQAIVSAGLVPNTSYDPHGTQCDYPVHTQSWRCAARQYLSARRGV